MAGFAQANGDSFADLLTDDTGSSGWVAGAGISYMLTDQWLLGGEILYHRFDDFVEAPEGNIDLTATTATLRASFKF